MSGVLYAKGNKRIVTGKDGGSPETGIAQKKVVVTGYDLHIRTGSIFERFDVW